MTSASEPKKNRKQQILETLAFMLEDNPGDRISIAALAKSVGVSEAALYRHFPSKTKMLEGLIEFAEEAVLSRASSIASDNLSALEKIERMTLVYLVFCERNPGITRLLTGDAISGERDRLHARVRQFFDRLGTEMRQVLRKSELEDGLRLTLSIHDTVALAQACAEGRVAAFVRNQFKLQPSANWQTTWQCLQSGLVNTSAL
ncbi:MAG TPA: nucleoid occlusion factor SlmA [Marinagarivorans sp.]